MPGQGEGPFSGDLTNGNEFNVIPGRATTEGGHAGSEAGLPPLASSGPPAGAAMPGQGEGPLSDDRITEMSLTSSQDEQASGHHM